MNCITRLETQPASLRLDARLTAVAEEIRSDSHSDIGSDHALLPRYLLESGRVKHIIAVEKHLLPFRNSQKALLGYAASVRLGDGFAVLAKAEAESVSITGMGAENILKILARAGDKLPQKLILQANDKPERLRHWALEHGFRLANERIVTGLKTFIVLSFVQEPGTDLAYKGLAKDLALVFGPLLLKRKDAGLANELAKQALYYQKCDKPWAKAKLERINRALNCYA